MDREKPGLTHPPVYSSVHVNVTARTPAARVSMGTRFLPDLEILLIFLTHEGSSSREEEPDQARGRLLAAPRPAGRL